MKKHQFFCVGEFVDKKAYAVRYETIEGLLAQVINNPIEDKLNAMLAKLQEFKHEFATQLSEEVAAGAPKPQKESVSVQASSTVPPPVPPPIPPVEKEEPEVIEEEPDDDGDVEEDLSELADFNDDTEGLDFDINKV